MTRLEIAVEMIEQMRSKGYEVLEHKEKMILDNAVNDEYMFWMNMQYMSIKIREAMER